jgi:predicted DNA-binding transcriptional regulator AlpA
MNVTRIIVDHLLGEYVSHEKLQHIASVLDDSNWCPYVPEPLLLNFKQAAQLLGCSRSYFWLLRRKGLVPTVRLGDSLYVRASDLDQLVKKLPQQKEIEC